MPIVEDFINCPECAQKYECLMLPEHPFRIIGINPDTGYEWLHRYFGLPRRKLGKPSIPLLPEGKFDVIYADPPWKYEFSETENRSIEAHYDTLLLEGAHVIMEEFEVWKRKRRFTGRITFYESPYLASQFGRPIKTHPVRLYRAEGKKKSTYDYLISCPVCGQFTMDYTGVPKGIDVFYGPDRGLGLMVIPLENIPEECIIAEHHENKSHEVASEILRKGLTKERG